MSARMDVHERTLTAENTEEMMEAYKEWADRYDSDLLGEWGYVAPSIATRLLANYLDKKEAKVLDAGCGTGIVGQCLHEQGYCNLVGLDYSRDMLGKAREKHLYKSLKKIDLTKPLDMPDNAYDAVISCGTFTLGHVGPEALSELARVTKPGGYVCFTVRDKFWEEEDFRARMLELENDGKWELQELRTSPYVEKEGANCKLCLCQVAA